VTVSPWSTSHTKAYDFTVNLAKHFGQAVRQHRELVRLSQEDLADRAKVDRTYVSGIERGKRNPTLDVLQRLSTALGVDLDVIFATAREIGSGRRARP
jgi:transcriptional regulator with XRE-family HTH domain